MPPITRRDLRRLGVTAVLAGVAITGLLSASLPLVAGSTTTTTTTIASTTTTVPPTTTTSAPTTTTTVPPTSTTTLRPPTTTTLRPPTTTTTTTVPPRRSDLPWPVRGSAAVVVPRLNVAASSPNQSKVPIASLTKMMSAWIVLHRYPLAYAQRGPCVTVSARDFAAYQHDVATGQSNVKIAEGLTLCEGILLRGLFVHSAGDYVELLVELLGMNQQQFVGVMNRDANAMGLHHTHYVDYTGISPGDVSTARDQATLAVDLMSHEQIVRQIVALTKVALPVAGEVYTYTPLLGMYGVIGVKSGYTGAAGGCDVMAIDVILNHNLYVTYAVVLGQFGVDPLALAGQAALVLSRKLRASMVLIASRSSRAVKWTGSPYDLAWRS